jgi:uncharacterized cupredoxin-like copper-binding protein
MGTLADAVLAVPLAGLLLVTGCASPGGRQAAGPRDITVWASEFKFDPANVTARANQPVRATVRNVGTVVHDWVVQGLEQPVETTAEPGQGGAVEFTPTRAGRFRVICAQPGHEAAGMVGQLIVQ